MAEKDYVRHDVFAISNEYEQEVSRAKDSLEKKSAEARQIVQDMIDSVNEEAKKTLGALANARKAHADLEALLQNAIELIDGVTKEASECELFQDAADVNEMQDANELQPLSELNSNAKSVNSTACGEKNQAPKECVKFLPVDETKDVVFSSD